MHSRAIIIQWRFCALLAVTAVGAVVVDFHHDGCPDGEIVGIGVDV